MYSWEIWADADPFCAGADPCIRNMSDIHAASEICRTSTLRIRNMSDIHAMYWESYYYVTNILICCGRCIAVKFGEMPIHSVQVPIHASENLSDIHAMHQKFIGHPLHVLGTIILCYQYINLLRPMYSCEIWADADPFCASEICRTSDIYTMYGEPYYYVTNILICCS